MKEETFRAMTSGLKFGEASPSAILRAAATKLANSYWIQGTTATAYYNETDVRRYDLTGVLIATTGFEIHEQAIRPGETRAHVDTNYFQKRNNYETWSNTIGRRGKQGFLKCLDYVVEITGEYDVERWNDEIAQSKQDVVDVLTRAADLAESRDD